MELQESDIVSTTTGTQAIDRAALLVATVVRADEPLSFGELQDECRLPKSTTSRLLTALERTELIERNDTGSYVAGPLFWLYATRHDPWDELVRLARPTLEKVGAETGETVNLSVARGDRVVQVAQVDSTYLLGTRDWTEVDVPAHCSALGKVLLAYGVIDVPTGELERLTPATITDRDALREALEQDARRGYASTVDELEIGLTGVERTRARQRWRSSSGAGHLGTQSAIGGSARRGRPTVERPGRAAVRAASETHEK